MQRKNQKDTNIGKYIVIVILLVFCFVIYYEPVIAQQATGVISGTVYAADSVTPLPNIYVHARSSAGTMGACSDGDGNYAITNLALGTEWSVSAGGGYNGCGGSEDYVEEYWQETPDMFSVTPILISEQNPQHNEINFTLEIGGSISGIVYTANGNPISNVEVSANGLIYGVPACTNANGHYVIKGLAFGHEWRMSAGVPYDWCGDGIDYYEEYWEETTGFDSANALMLSAGNSQIPNINFTLDEQFGGTLDELVQIIDGMSEEELSGKIKNSLIQKIINAQTSIDNGNVGVAINKLSAFVNEVEAQKGKKISVGVAEILVTYAENMIGTLMH